MWMYVRKQLVKPYSSTTKFFFVGVGVGACVFDTSMGYKTNKTRTCLTNIHSLSTTFFYIGRVVRQLLIPRESHLQKCKRRMPIIALLICNRPKSTSL